MLTLYDFLDSGNGYKVRLLLALLKRTYRWVVDHRSTLSRLIPARAKQHATEHIELRTRPASARGPEPA